VLTAILQPIVVPEVTNYCKFIDIVFIFAYLSVFQIADPEHRQRKIELFLG